MRGDLRARVGTAQNKRRDQRDFVLRHAVTLEKTAHLRVDDNYFIEPPHGEPAPTKRFGGFAKPGIGETARMKSQDGFSAGQNAAHKRERREPQRKIAADVQMNDVGALREQKAKKLPAVMRVKFIGRGGNFARTADCDV